MQKITIKAYAVKHKLSLFNVMKMVKSEKLQSEVTEVDGKEVTFILVDEETEAEIKKGIIPVENKSEIKLHEEMLLLRNEVKLLRTEIEAVKKEIYKKDNYV